MLLSKRYETLSTSLMVAMARVEPVQVIQCSPVFGYGVDFIYIALNELEDNLSLTMTCGRAKVISQVFLRSTWAALGCFSLYIYSVCLVKHLSFIVPS